MFGITSAQTLVYFNAPRKDTAVMKWAVSSVHIDHLGVTDHSQPFQIFILWYVKFSTISASCHNKRFYIRLVDLLETILYTHSAYQYTVTALINPVLFYTFVWYVYLYDVVCYDIDKPSVLRSSGVCTQPFRSVKNCY